MRSSVLVAAIVAASVGCAPAPHAVGGTTSVSAAPAAAAEPPVPPVDERHQVRAWCKESGGKRRLLAPSTAGPYELRRLDAEGYTVRATTSPGYGNSEYSLQIDRGAERIAVAHVWSNLYHLGTSLDRYVRGRLPPGLTPEQVAQILAPIAAREVATLGLVVTLGPGRVVECELRLHPVGSAADPSEDGYPGAP